MCISSTNITDVKYHRCEKQHIAEYGFAYHMFRLHFVQGVQDRMQGPPFHLHSNLQLLPLLIFPELSHQSCWPKANKSSVSFSLEGQTWA